MIKVLSQLFSDIDAGEVTSRTYNKASEISEYFEALPEALSVAKQVETVPYRFASTDLKDGVKRPRLAAKAAPAPVAKVKRITPPRMTLAPARHPFAEPTEEKGKQLLREASRLKLRDVPLGCAFLFCAMLEFATDTEMRVSGISDRNADGQSLDLKGRFNAVADYLINTPGRLQKKGDLNPIKTTLNAQHGTVTIAALNGYIHNRYQKPSPDDLRNAWDHAIPLFRPSPSGHFSPLRYPGGKGKLARFVADVIRSNGLQDGTYVEPYAGGAAVAFELLLTGVVRRVAINDINKPIYAFWRAVLDDTVALVGLIRETEVTMEVRERAKRLFMEGSGTSLELAFATFFLNRTNRSGILNGGPIGGVDQQGAWKLDVRYNKEALIERIEKISRMRKRISLTNLNAIEFLNAAAPAWPRKTLVYLDPPYYEKGRDLYYNFYKHDDHANVAFATHNLKNVRWIVSYDDVRPIHSLYDAVSCLQYTIGYSARDRSRGAEAMFFSPGLRMPQVQGSMVELYRSGGQDGPENGDAALSFSGTRRETKHA